MYQPDAPSRLTQCIAAILNQPDVVFLGESRNSIQIKNIPQSVRDEDRLGLGGECGGQLTDVDFVCRQNHINEHRNQAVLEDWIQGGWKPAATVITSSPGLRRRSASLLEVSALIAKRLAEEPEFTREAHRTLRNAPASARTLPQSDRS